MYIKKNPRVTFRSNRRPNFKRNNNFSNNKPKNKGNVTQQYNKYLKLAKEASSSGDRIQSEYYYQFTDHYYRIMLELGITLEENDSNEDKIDENTSESENILLNVKKNDVVQTSDNSIDNINEDTNNDDIESIESIPFISDPVKKKSPKTLKSAKTKKVSA